MRLRWTWIIILLLAIGAGAGVGFWLSQPPSAPALAAAPVAARARRETKPTIDPALLVGKAATAYRVAREIPDVLDQMYCYCGCDKSVGHVSLLSCYTDSHAAT